MKERRLIITSFNMFLMRSKETFYCFYEVFVC
jgi:hypothetical protein